jgi:hypothetical protein
MEGWNVIRFKHDGVSYDVEELPLDRWIKIQEQTGRQWHECLNKTLLADAKVAKAVLEACAAEAGVTLPALTVKTMMQLFRFDAVENTPVQYNEGIPDPKAKGSDLATT